MMSEPNYFFLVGSPRSGTTLLQTMLMRAPGVTMPPELHYVQITYRRRGRMPDIRTDAGWEQARNAIRARCAHTEIDMDGALFDRMCAGCDRNYGDLLRAWLKAIGALEGAATIGEKTPGHCDCIPELATMIPEARFIHIMRDPRDSALSQREAFGLPALQAALRWRRDLRCHLDAMRLMPPTRYTAVRYEDLVTDPAAALQPLCAFLGLEFRDEMLDPAGRTKKGFAAHEAHKLRTLEKVTASRIGRYRNAMSAIDIAVIEYFCGPIMEEMGYQLERKPKALAWLGIVLQTPVVILRRLRTNRRRHAMLDSEAAHGKPVFHQQPQS